MKCKRNSQRVLSFLQIQGSIADFCQGSIPQKKTASLNGHPIPAGVLKSGCSLKSAVCEARYIRHGGEPVGKERRKCSSLRRSRYFGFQKLLDLFKRIRYTKIKMKEYSAKACAKINIGLKVLGRRADGYHDIETIFQSIDLCDEISISTAEKGIQIISGHRDVPADETNLCWRAAQLLQAFSGEKRGCNIHIAKRIPVGAGLGGGSSDAAVTLRLLNRLWNLGLDDEVLFKIALKLGADVPFFLNPGSAVAYGVGEELRRFENKCVFFGVVVYPNIRISTAWAYGNLKLNLTNKKNYIKLETYFVEKLLLQEYPLFFSNDFESLVLEFYPELNEIKALILKSGADFAGLSGSGSAFFGLFQQEEKAKAALTLFDSHPYQKFFVRPYREVPD